MSTWNSNPWMFGLGGVGLTVGVIFLIVLIALKGYSLWYAAKRDHRWWFIAILFLNTLGVLELIYLVFVIKKLRRNQP